MNLWNVLKRLIPFYGAFLQKKDRTERLNEAGLENTSSPYENFFSNLDSAANSLKDKYTGSALTEAEREANAFTASREDIAWQRQMEADSTVYQRRVADMQAAGINPLLAAGGVGVSSPSASAGPSVSPSIGNLSGLLSAFASLSLARSQKKNIDADTELKRSEAAQNTQQIDYFERVKGFREEGEHLQNDMKRSEMKQIEQNISESRSRISKNIADANEADKRAALAVEQAILARAEADNIVYMQPFIAGELSARSESERVQARAAAVHAAYEQGLISEGAIAAAVRKDKATASSLEVDARIKDFKQSIADGSLAKAAERFGDWRSGVIYSLYTGLGNAVKTALGKW